MVRYLVFRKEDPKRSKLTFMALNSVAKFLGKSTSYVHKICQNLRNGKYIDENDHEKDKSGSTIYDNHKMIKNQHFTNE